MPSAGLRPAAHPHGGDPYERVCTRMNCNQNCTLAAGRGRFSVLPRRSQAFGTPDRLPHRCNTLSESARLGWGSRRPGKSAMVATAICVACCN